MNIDTRARRAADGVRASARGVDPMAQIAELKHEDKARRRTTSTGAVFGAALVMAGTGWFVVSQLGGGSDAPPGEPMSTPSTSPSAVASLEPGLPVGTGLRPRLVAQAPDAWEVFADARYVWMDSDGEPNGPSIQIGGPVEKVWEYDLNRPVDVSIGGCFSMNSCNGYNYTEYLLGHPSLELLESRIVTIDGRQFVQRTFQVKDGARSTPGYDGVILGKFDGIDTGHPWGEVARGDVFTETVIEVGDRPAGRDDSAAEGDIGDIMVVRATGADTATEQAELEAALDLVLTTMKLPR